MKRARAAPKRPHCSAVKTRQQYVSATRASALAQPRTPACSGAHRQPAPSLSLSDLPTLHPRAFRAHSAPSSSVQGAWVCLSVPRAARRAHRRAGARRFFRRPPLTRPPLTFFSSAALSRRSPRLLRASQAHLGWGRRQAPRAVAVRCAARELALAQGSLALGLFSLQGASARIRPPLSRHPAHSLLPCVPQKKRHTQTHRTPTMTGRPSRPARSARRAPAAPTRRSTQPG